MAEHPAGFLEHGEAFSPKGNYGKWLRQHASIVKIGGVIFLHGGISPNLVSLQLEQINSQVRAEIEEFDRTKQDLVSRKVILPFFTIQEIAVAVQLEVLAERAAETPPDAEYHNRLVRLLGFNNWLSMRDDGPLWFRGYDQWSEEQGDPQIEKVLAAYNSAHIVVAHTVQKMGHIRSRFGGKVAVAGISLTSFVAQQAASHCHLWPAVARPDAVMLINHSGRIENVAFGGALAATLGLDRALADAGWTHASLARLAQAANPAETPAVAPERIVSVLGETDRWVPYEDGAALVRQWKLPDANVFRYRLGHLGMPVQLMRDAEPFERLRQVLVG